jgi:16S rRNA pseudouridine516 synthase
VPRFDLLVAHNLDWSRSHATRRIREGALAAADGTPLRDAKAKIDPAQLPLAVTVYGEPRTLRAQMHLVQHKPVGAVTALEDHLHPTAYGLLEGAPLRRHLRAVGRLDLQTSGLLAWTTDGTLLHRLTHPRWGLPRTYHAALDREPLPLPPDLVLDDGHRPTIVSLEVLVRAHPALVGASPGAPLRAITIVGGKFHEVRRIFGALGSQVQALCRTSFGALQLPADLAAGAWIDADLPSLVRGLAPST